MEESTCRAIFAEGREPNRRLRAFRYVKWSLIRPEVRPNPPRMGGIDLDVRPLQQVRLHNRQHVQRRLR